MVTSQTIRSTFSAPNYLKKSYNMATGLRLTVYNSTYNTQMLMKQELLFNKTTIV
jgi:hypothetical protein